MSKYEEAKKRLLPIIEGHVGNLVEEFKEHGWEDFEIDLQFILNDISYLKKLKWEEYYFKRNGMSVEEKKISKQTSIEVRKKYNKMQESA